MHRHRTRHRARRARSSRPSRPSLRRGGLTVAAAATAVTTAVATAAVLIGPLSSGNGGAALHPGGAVSSSTAPLDLAAVDPATADLATADPVAADPASADPGTAGPAGADPAGSAVVDRGVVSGVLRLVTAAAPDPDTWVAYVIKGPANLVKISSAPPYGTEVDTRQLPDGSYTVNEVVFHSASVPKVALSRVRISNEAGAPSTAPTEPAAESTTPAAPLPPITPGSQVTPDSQAPLDAPDEPELTGLPSGTGPVVGSSSPPSPASPSSSSPVPPSATQPVSPTVPLPSVSAPLPTTAVPTPTPPSSATVTSPPPQPLAAPQGGPIEQIVVLTNAERAKVGCGPLRVDSRLAAAAQAHSADMALNNYFSHTSRDGRSPFQRIADAGYTFSLAAENLAGGQRTAVDAVAGWMQSAGHRANLLNCSLTQIGVGYATGGSYGTYWTQDFGTP